MADVLLPSAVSAPHDSAGASTPGGSSALEDPAPAGCAEHALAMFEGESLAEALKAAMGSEWGDEQVAEAVAMFEAGDFQGARALALEAASALGAVVQSAAGPPEEDDESRRSSHSASQGRFEDASFEQSSTAAAMAREWRVALDELARVYDDAGDADRAEALYLRILAWREGVDQYRDGNFGVAEHLFQKSPHYRSVEDATWFLQSLRPDDGHAVPEVVGLLALGEEVAAKAAVGVWTLALKKENREQIFRCGGLELVAKAMQYHAESAELQAAGCGALRLMSGGHPLAAASREAIAGRLGGVALLLSALAGHPLDAEVQREAMGTLQAVAARSRETALNIVESDGIGLALRAATECPDEGVGEAACKLLTALRRASAAGDDDTPEGVEPLVQSRKLQALDFCDRMLRKQLSQAQGPDRLVVQALLSIAAIFLDDIAVARRMLGLVQVVVPCVNRYPGQLKVQQPGVTALWRLTDAAREADDVTDLGQSIAPVVAAMRDLPTSLEVQKSALGALASVAQEDNGLKTLGVRAGGIQASIDAMKRFPQDADLQSRGLGALTRLCDTLGRAAVCSKSGGLQAVVAALRRHAGFGRVAEMGCVLLCMFCDDAQLRQQVLEAGALEVAKSLLRAQRPEAQHWGQELLKDLSSIAGGR